jgi:hypothetical protein
MLSVRTLPAEPVENELIKDLDVFIADMVTFPADAVEPL